MNSDRKNEITRKRIIALETLERYTGSPANSFQKYILLTNFQYYVDEFRATDGRSFHQGSAMSVIHDMSEKISLIRFGIGSPNAALITDLLAAVEPCAIVFLGMCGGLSEKQMVGDFFLPSAAIRDEGTSRHYLPQRVPALPYFHIQRRLSLTLDSRSLFYRHGIIHTTNYRFWEFDENFRDQLIAERAKAIDMECATLFSVGYSLHLKVGALLLISDLPLTAGGIKTKSSAESVFKQFTKQHLDVGLESLTTMRDREESSFDEI